MFIRSVLACGRTVKFHGIFAVKFCRSVICFNGISAGGVKFGGIFRSKISIRRISRGGLLAAVILRARILRYEILCGEILRDAHLARAVFAEVYAASRPGDHLFVHAAVGLDEGVFSETKFINPPVHAKLVCEA